MSLNYHYETFQLLSRVSINKYLQKGSRYIYFGLVQVAVKPSTKLGIDTSVFLALRDDRLKTYKDSLLAMVQSNVCNGLIYFNCCPNYSVDLTDPLILQTLVLDVYWMTDKFKELSKNLAVTYRVYFRLLSSKLNPKFSIIPRKKEETVLIQVCIDESSLMSLKG